MLIRHKHNKQCIQNNSLNNDSSFLSGAWLRHCSINNAAPICRVYCTASLQTYALESIEHCSPCLRSQMIIPNAIIINFCHFCYLLFSFVTNSQHTKHNDCITYTRAIIHVEKNALCTLSTKCNFIDKHT